ncbi:Na(+)/H(+) antiporter subunit B [Rickettsiales bacterium LUAb2]
MFNFNQNTFNDHFLRITVLLLLPIICLYAFYVQIHGELSPGGGFQAGVILSVAYIMFIMVYGLEKSEQFIPAKTLLILSGIGVLIYALTGIFTMLLGGNFLEYSVLSFAGSGTKIGLFIIELGVGLCVFASFSFIIFNFYSLAIQEKVEEETKILSTEENQLQEESDKEQEDINNES